MEQVLYMIVKTYFPSGYSDYQPYLEAFRWVIAVISNIAFSELRLPALFVALAIFACQESEEICI